MIRHLKKITQGTIAAFIIATMFLISSVSVFAADELQKPKESRNVIVIDMEKSNEQTLVLENRDDIVVGYLLGTELDTYNINEDTIVKVNYPKDSSAIYTLNINLNYENIATMGKIEANLLDINASGNINVKGSAQLQLLKSLDLGQNSLNLENSQIFIENGVLSVKDLVMSDDAVLNIKSDFGTAPSLKLGSLEMDKSKLEILTEHGEGIVLGDEGNYINNSITIKNKSQVNITSAGDGIKAISSLENMKYSINDSSINVFGNYQGYNSTGIRLSHNLEVQDSKINVTKHQNGLTGTSLGVDNSEIVISTVQEKISDEFGTGVYLSGNLTMNTSNMTIESPLDIGYQNNVQAIWAGKITLGDSSNLTENYVGPFHVNSDKEVDIYFNGGIGSQMTSMGNYAITNSNENLVYNEESKKFISKSTRIQSDEIILKRTKDIADEKISLGKVSSHKIVIPVSLDGAPPNQVAFNTNEGTMIKIQNIENGDRLVRPEDPVKEGFDFENWYKDEKMTEVFDFSTPLDSNLSLYAKWTDEKPKIMLDMAGATETKAAQTIIKGEAGNTVDITSYQKGGENQPVKSGHIFLGWADETGNVIDNTVDLKDANIKLEAKWLSLKSFLDELEGKNITAYKGEATVDSINSQLINFLEHDDNGKNVQLAVNYDWNQNILSVGGITKAIPYIIDLNTGEKIFGDSGGETNIYILNKPYVQARDSVSFGSNDKVSIDGREWQAVGIAELPDYSTKSISRTNFNVIYNGSHINTFELGEYDVIFSGHINDLNGDLINVEKVVKAQVEKIDNSAGMFWGQLGEEVKKLRKNKFYSSNTVLSETKETEKILGKSDFNRSLIITPNEKTVMNPGFLSAVGKNKNTLVRIDMGENQWDLYGRNFIDRTNDGRLDVKVSQTTEVSNELKALLTDVEHEALSFEMDSRWGAEAIFRRKLSFDTTGHVPYMFSWNQDTKELELVGAMKKDNDGYYSIGMNRVVKNYVITKGLPASIIGSEDSKVSTLPIFRITEATNNLEEATYEKISASLLATGGFIKDITLVKPVLTDLDAQIDQALRDRQIVAAILIFLIFVLSSIVLINRIVQSRRKKVYSAENFIGIQDLIEESLPERNIKKFIPMFTKEALETYSDVILQSKKEEPEVAQKSVKIEDVAKEGVVVPAAELENEELEIFYNSALLNLAPKYLKDRNKKKEKAAKALETEDRSFLDQVLKEETAKEEIKEIISEVKEDLKSEKIFNEATVTNQETRVEPINIEKTYMSILSLADKYDIDNSSDEPEKTKEKVKFYTKEDVKTKKTMEQTINALEEKTNEKDVFLEETVTKPKEKEERSIEEQISFTLEEGMRIARKEQEKNLFSSNFRARVVKEKEEKTAPIRRSRLTNNVSSLGETADLVFKKEDKGFKPDAVTIKEIREDYFKKDLALEKTISPTEEFEKISEAILDSNKYENVDLGHQISKKNTEIDTSRRVKVLAEGADEINFNTLEGRADLSKKRQGWTTKTKSEVWGSYGSYLQKNIERQDSK